MEAEESTGGEEAGPVSKKVGKKKLRHLEAACQQEPGVAVHWISLMAAYGQVRVKLSPLILVEHCLKFADLRAYLLCGCVCGRCFVWCCGQVSIL